MLNAAAAGREPAESNRRRARPQDVDRHVGRKIRERRLMLGLTQQQMAELIHITYQQAQKYEAGVNRVSAGRLSIIAQVLGVEIGYFFQGATGVSAVTPSAATPGELPGGQRLLLEFARSFVGLSRRQQEVLCTLVRTLASEAEERVADVEEEGADERAA